jgi:thiol-disulfide isomerase/thioredoxin
MDASRQALAVCFTDVILMLPYLTWLPIFRGAAVLSGLLAVSVASQRSAGPEVVHVDLAYKAPGTGPAPNFSPKGTQVSLADVSAAMTLPTGAVRPAKIGKMAIGPDDSAWIPVLATADIDHPKDLCRLFVDKNRNGNFADDPLIAPVTPSQNEKTKAWWSSFNKVELSIPYAALKTVEPYLVNFWIVREDTEGAPNIVRYSVGSWRSGTTTIHGIPALVAAMDGNNDAIFSKNDSWSVLEAGAPNADKAVLTTTEARDTGRLMFVSDGTREFVLEFMKFSPDGRSIDFAVVDKPVTKKDDRAGDDITASERSRPRATTAFAWSQNLDAAMSQAKTSGRKIIIDFETTWCGPCHTMDQWVWTDAEVASLLTQGFVGVKLDGDVEKALVKRFDVKGYPTMIVLDGTGAVVKQALGYKSSTAMVEFLK